MSQGLRPSTRRLDVAVAETLGVSRAEARRLLMAGRVAIDGKPSGLLEKGSQVRADVRITVPDYKEKRSRRPIAEPNMPLCFLAEGSGWVAVDKPAGLPVNPHDEGERGTVLNALIAHRPEIFGIGEGGLRSGVLHRLDVPTSGVLIFGTSRDRWDSLRAAFTSHRVKKLYRAVVEGTPEQSGSIELELAVTQHRPARVRVFHSQRGRRKSWPTRLSWTTTEKLDQATVLEVSLETGFLHQIRASFAELGHPILGDVIYGGSDISRSADRLMLHASSLHFLDVFAQSPDPTDFQMTIERLRRRQ